MKFLLDTSTVSWLLRKDPNVRERFAALHTEDWAVSTITEGELLAGLALKPEATRLAKAVRGFLQHATVLNWNREAAQAYGGLRAALSRDGTSIGPLDEMIAAHAMSLDAVCVTDNVKDFERVQGLAVMNWRRSVCGR